MNNYSNITKNICDWKGGVTMRKFVPHAVYYEEDAKNYELGKELIKKYNKCLDKYKTLEFE